MKVNVRFTSGPLSPADSLVVRDALALLQSKGFRFAYSYEPRDFSMSICDKVEVEDSQEVSRLSRLNSELYSDIAKLKLENERLKRELEEAKALALF